MKKKLIEFVIGLFFFLLLVTHCIFSGDDVYLEKSRMFKGIVSKKFNNPNNRNYPTLEILISEKGKKRTENISGSGLKNEIYKYAILGDSIYKAEDSLQYILKRNTTTMIFEYNDSCRCYKKIQ